MTWTKEQLKTLAGATPNATRSSSTLTQFSEPTLTSEEEEYSLKKRNFTTRAIPKAIFAAFVVAPAFAFAYFFMSGNLSRSQKVSAQPQVDPETQQLREQLAASVAQLDEVQAKLAAMRQEKSPSAPPPNKQNDRSVKKIKPIPPRQPQRVVKVSTPPRSLPPRTISPTPIRRSLPRTPIVRPSSVNKAPQVVEPTVYGAGAIDGELISSKGEVETVQADYSPQSRDGAYKPLREPQGTAPQEVQLENSQQSVESVDESDNETTTIDPALEAPLVTEQSMVRLNAGTVAKATLAVPFVRDPRSDKQNIFTIHLDEPLIAQTGDIVLPVGTTILVKAELIESANIVEFVGVEAYDPSSQKIPLPHGAIRFSDPEGLPIVARTLESDSDDDDDDRSIIEELEQVIEVGSSLEDVLSGDRALRGIDNTLGDIQDLVESDGRQSRNRSGRVLYLPAKTEVQLYVAKDLVVPVPEDVNELSTSQDAPPSEYDSQSVNESQLEEFSLPNEVSDPYNDFFIDRESVLFSDFY